MQCIDIKVFSYIWCKGSHSTIMFTDLAGIVPGGKYNADQFKKALKLAVGKDVDLRCNTNSATGERQLYEVLICYDPEDKKVIDCGPHNVPGPGTWACPGNVVLPRKPCKPSSERRCDSDA
jgi:hypothetical protein